MQACTQEKQLPSGHLLLGSLVFDALQQSIPCVGVACTLSRKTNKCQLANELTHTHTVTYLPAGLAIMPDRARVVKAWPVGPSFWVTCVLGS